MIYKTIYNVLCISIILFSLNANSALSSRLGGLAYYDDTLNITWLTDANYASTSGYSTDNSKGELDKFGNIQNDGRMDGNEATIWATSLNIRGVTNWRLPDMDVNGDDTIINCGFASISQEACKDNEFSHLFVYGSGVVFNNGITFSNSGPFTNIQATRYWSGTLSVPSPNIDSWYFNMLNGGQIAGGRNISNYAWAVYDGDVALISSIPVPPSILLFVTGALGLFGFSIRKST